MCTKIYYRNESGKEIAAGIRKIPEKCGDCGYCNSSETYSHYDDLEGWDVYDMEIMCSANKMVICKFRREGSLRFDYGYEESVLGERAGNCPLYAKSRKGCIRRKLKI